MRITRSELKQADPKNVRRLANFLRLHTAGYSDRQVVNLITWRLAPERAWGTGYY